MRYDVRLAIDRAEARQGDRAVQVKVLTGGEDSVGFQGRFETGPATLRIAYD